MESSSKKYFEGAPQKFLSKRLFIFNNGQSIYISFNKKLDINVKTSLNEGYDAKLLQEMGVFLQYL